MSNLYRRATRSAFAAIALGLLILLVAACSNVDASTSIVNNSQKAEASKLLDNLNPQQIQQLIPYGHALLVWNPQTQKLVVMVSLTGLVPNSTHPSHIHQGNCTSNGAILYPLSNVVADGHGNAFTITVISGVATGIPATGWYINVHHGPGLTTPEQMAPIYCGNVTNPDPKTNHTQIIKVRLSSTSPMH